MQEEEFSGTTRATAAANGIIIAVTRMEFSLTRRICKISW
jgi:hypothetical protein